MVDSPVAKFPGFLHLCLSCGNLYCLRKFFRQDDQAIRKNVIFFYLSHSLVWKGMTGDLYPCLLFHYIELRTTSFKPTDGGTVPIWSSNLETGIKQKTPRLNMPPYEI